MEILKKIMRIKSRLLVFILLTEVQTTYGQFSIKDRILMDVFPKLNPVSITNIAPNGRINSTVYGNIYNFYSTPREKERNQIKSEFSNTPKTKQRIKIVKLTNIDDVLYNRDTSVINYHNTFTYLESEIRANIEKNFRLAIEQAHTLEKLAKLKNDSFLLANAYALLFYMYASEDFHEYALTYGALADSLIRKNPYDEKYTIKTIDLISSGYNLLDNYNKVIEIENYALAIKQKHLHLIHRSVARSLYKLGYSYASLGKLDSQYLFYTQAVRILEHDEKSYDVIGSDRIFVNWALLRFDSTKDLNTSIHYFKKAIDIAKLNKDSNSLAEVYTDFGLLYRRANKYDSMIYYTKLSLNIYEKLKVNYQQKRVPNYNLGCAYYYLDIDDSTYKYFRDALIGYEHDTIKGNQYYINWTKYCMGISSRNKQQYIESLHLLKEAYSYFKIENGFTAWETRNSLYRRGIIYYELKKYDSAILYIDSAIILTHKYASNYKYIHEYYWSRALAYELKENKLKALSDIDTAIYYYHNQSYHNKKDLVTLMSIKSDYLNDLGQYEEAINLQKKILELCHSDTTLLQRNCLKIIYKLISLSLNKKDSSSANSYLVTCYNLIKGKSFTDYFYYSEISKLCASLKQNKLGLLILEEEKKSIINNSKIDFIEKEDLLFRNEINAIQLMSGDSRRYRIVNFDRTIKQSDRRFFEKKLLVNIFLLPIYASDMDTILFKELVSSTISLLDEYKDKLDKTSYNGIKYPFAILDLFLKATTNPTVSYFTEFVNLQKEYKATPTNFFSVTIKGLNFEPNTIFAAVADFYFTEIKNYTESSKYFKQALKYAKNIDEKSTIFYHILISDFYGKKDFTYLDSTINYIDYYTEGERNCVYFISSESAIAQKNYTKAKDHLELITKSGYTWKILLNKVLSYVITSDFYNAERSFMQFISEYDLNVIKNKKGYATMIEEIIRNIIEKKDYRLFNLVINNIEKYTEIGIIKLYWVYYYLSIGEQTKAISLLKTSTILYKYKCSILANNPQLDKIRNTQDFIDILLNCNH